MVDELIERLQEKYKYLIGEFKDGYWNYRVIEKESRFTYKDGKYAGKTRVELYYEIHEIYYDGEGNPVAWSADPMRMYFQEKEDPKYYIKRIREASRHKIFKLEEYVDEDGEKYERLVKLDKRIIDLKSEDTDYMIDENGEKYE